MLSALGGLRTRRAARLDTGQRRDQWLIIVGSDAVESLESTLHTSMHDDLFAIGTLEDADGFHHAFARAEAVTRPLGVYMARVEAEGTVVAIASSAGQ